MPYRCIPGLAIMGAMQVVTHFWHEQCCYSNTNYRKDMSDGTIARPWGHRNLDKQLPRRMDHAGWRWGIGYAYSCYHNCPNPCPRPTCPRWRTRDWKLTKRIIHGERERWRYNFEDFLWLPPWYRKWRKKEAAKEAKAMEQGTYVPDPYDPQLFYYYYDAFFTKTWHFTSASRLNGDILGWVRFHLMKMPLQNFGEAYGQTANGHG